MNHSLFNEIMSIGQKYWIEEVMNDLKQEKWINYESKNE